MHAVHNNLTCLRSPRSDGVQVYGVEIARKPGEKGLISFAESFRC
jgi:hypothetical protein